MGRKCCTGKNVEALNEGYGSLTMHVNNAMKFFKKRRIVALPLVGLAKIVKDLSIIAVVIGGQHPENTNPKSVLALANKGANEPVFFIIVDVSNVLVLHVAVWRRNCVLSGSV